MPLSRFRRGEARDRGTVGKASIGCQHVRSNSLRGKVSYRCRRPRSPLRRRFFSIRLTLTGMTFAVRKPRGIPVGRFTTQGSLCGRRKQEYQPTLIEEIEPKLNNGVPGPRKLVNSTPELLRFSPFYRKAGAVLYGYLPNAI